MSFDSTNMYPTYRVLRLNRGGGKVIFSTATNTVDASVILRQDGFDPYGRQTQMYFVSNALPGYLELELGVLEPATFKQLQSLYPPSQAADAFLKKQAAKVHLFRQRIPIRTALQ